MPQSLVKVLVHIVFSTKDRQRLIPPEIEAQLFGYISGILTNNSARLIIGGGTADHIHLLVSIGRIDIGELIGDIKRESSRWMKKHGVTNFYWQLRSVLYRTIAGSPCNSIHPKPKRTSPDTNLSGRIPGIVSEIRCRIR